MYQLTFTNHSNVSLELVGGGHAIPSGGGMEVRQLGGRDHHRSDARHAQLPRHRRYAHRGHSDETWGVLIAYQGEEYVGRYEGGGQLAVEINAYYQAALSGMDLRQVYLPAIETAGAVTTA